RLATSLIVGIKSRPYAYFEIIIYHNEKKNLIYKKTNGKNTIFSNPWHSLVLTGGQNIPSAINYLLVNLVVGGYQWKEQESL
ncbi:MAG TPA: hypothetical protein P5042_05245, partial [Candidatus Izemoplasmatales bacterium]|nr:hypothetical protein [Candidatus Izemoplasmatales bacterium]